MLIELSQLQSGSYFRHRERGTSAAIFCLEFSLTSSVPTDNRQLRTDNRELTKNRLPRQLTLPRNDAAFSFRHRERGTSAAIFCLEFPVPSSVSTNNRNS